MSDFSRLEMMIGLENLNKLKTKKVIVFGIGGVGGYVVEALTRSAIGRIDIVDSDKISSSNINRQIIALNSTIGQYKTEVMKKRMLDINSEINVETYNIFFLPDNQDEIDFSKYDYIIDAIDTIKAKIALVECAKKYDIPIISSMGTGNKLNPSMLEVSDIYKTSVCPLARVMRQELKKRNIDKLKVVYSKETPIKNKNIDGKNIPSSNSFVPSVAGLIIASEVVKDLLNI